MGLAAPELNSPVSRSVTSRIRKLATCATFSIHHLILDDIPVVDYVVLEHGYCESFCLS